MPTFQLFAARDGDTVSELIDVEPSGTDLIDKQGAEGKAFAIICKAFQLDEDAYEDFDDLRADLDGCELTDLAEQHAAAQRIDAESTHNRALRLVEQIARMSKSDDVFPVPAPNDEAEALDGLIERARAIASVEPCNTTAAEPGELRHSADLGGYEEPDPLPDRRWRVRFYKEEMTVDRYSITVAGASPAEARARVAAWGNGEIELTDDEAESEHYDRQVDTCASEFSALEEEGDPYAAIEVDENGKEIDAFTEAEPDPLIALEPTA